VGQNICYSDITFSVR